MPAGATLDEETNKVTITKLDVGASVTLTASYTVTQADVDKQATMTNAATVAAKNPQNTDPVQPENPSSVTFDPEAKDPSFTVVKSVTSTGSADGGKYKAGETVQYQIVVTNTGNVTLSDIEVEDQLQHLMQMPRSHSERCRQVRLSMRRPTKSRSPSWM